MPSPHSTMLGRAFQWMKSNSWRKSTPVTSTPSLTGDSESVPIWHWRWSSLRPDSSSWAGFQLLTRDLLLSSFRMPSDTEAGTGS